MKKAVVLMLILAMCLSVCACSGEKTPDDGAHAYLPYAYGQWEQEELDDPAFKKSPCSNVTINEDGTCSVDSAAGQWTISENSSDHALILDIHVSEDSKFCFFMTRPGQVDIRAADAGGFHMDYSWENKTHKPDSNDIVLTADNWKQYFDLHTEATWQVPETAQEPRALVQYLTLKEEYAKRWLGNDRVVAKIEGTGQWLPITLGAADNSYTLGKTTGEEKIEAKTCGWVIDESKKTYQFMLWAFEVNPEMQEVLLFSDIKDINLLQIQGTLYLD